MNQQMNKKQNNSFEDKHQILTETVAHLFNTITDQDILRETSEGWLIEERVITKAEQDILTAQAKSLLESRLWQVLQKDIKWQAGKIGWLGAKDMMDVAMGKMIIYTLDIINTRLKSLAKGKGIFNK